jgi:hypothetical protein
MNRQHFPTSWRVVPFLEVVSDKTGGNPRIRQREYRIMVGYLLLTRVKKM